MPFIVQPPVAEAYKWTVISSPTVKDASVVKTIDCKVVPEATRKEYRITEPFFFKVNLYGPSFVTLINNNIMPTE